jgi:hypothetical protein
VRLLPVPPDLLGKRGVSWALASPASAVHSGADGPLVNGADRLANIALFVIALATWAGVAVVAVGFDPRANAAVLLAGALLLGAALATTVAPVLWLVGYSRQGRIAYRGDWWRAARRAGLVGLVAAIFVVLRGEQALNLPLALFVVAMAVLVELTLSLRR